MSKKEELIKFCKKAFKQKQEVLLEIMSITEMSNNIILTKRDVDYLDDFDNDLVRVDDENEYTKILNWEGI